MWANALRAFQVGEGPYELRGTVELDAAVAYGCGPAGLAGVPLDERLGFRGDVEVFVEAGGTPCKSRCLRAR